MLSIEQRGRRRAAGFSLLEMVVAMAILALALGALYQAASGATRNVRSDEKYAYGVELARTLLANYARVPRDGVSAGGETAGGFDWRVVTRPVDLERTALAAASLQTIAVTVRWQDGVRSREVVLDSVVEGSAQ
ncbi:MAG: prepilin-type N-terminal cleavage/methylation domain-containing protein [Halioglobus sp.]|nr:prepilin-type N-terminal cleavage/methylation domain-containing protein [Halioglobus sp.]MCB1707822.1 prepilin-type N-terminal cleavage/methylation domain-containing protein [Halioglobus sp.]MCP5123934.1 prepilin-type N-terminal cleavage/methylation domain-containing protein [Pseudomonadales bacterium]